MKNLIKSAFVIMLIFIAPTLQAKSTLDPVLITRNAGSPNTAETQKMLDRLEKIKAMDVSKMRSKEKRTLRKEVKATEKKVHSSGVYIPVGALVTIVLLLIILL